MSKPEIKRPQIVKQKSKDLHVNFLGAQSEEAKDEKKKYLTAKYGAKEINLIRKRLEVENWTLDRLNELCEANDENGNQIELEIDRLLELENDDDKKNYLLDKLESLKKVQKQEIDQFVQGLLEKLKSVANL